MPLGIKLKVFSLFLISIIIVLFYENIKCFYVISNIIAGVIWGILFFILDQQLLNRNEDKLSLRWLFKFDEVDNKLQLEVINHIIYSIFIGCIFFLYYIKQILFGAIIYEILNQT